MASQLNPPSNESAPYSTPIAIFGFNRPDLMLRQIEMLRAIRPRHLLVVLDGARAGRPDEAALCEAVVSTLASVDWPCDLEVHRAEINLGCRKRLATGITWVFSRVDHAILLEDDCAPHPDFFRYAPELLARYAGDERVMHISGFSPVAAGDSPTSYAFTSFPMIWGWATWRRAWNHYDESLSKWATPHAQWRLFRALPFLGYLYWNRKFLKIRRGFNTWDYQWTFACLVRGGLSALPRSNLMVNLGFRADATHTTDGAQAPDFVTAPLAFPLVHPAVTLNHARDRAVLHSMWRGFTWWKNLG